MIQTETVELHVENKWLPLIFWVGKMMEMCRIFQLFYDSSN